MLKLLIATCFVINFAHAQSFRLETKVFSPGDFVKLIGPHLPAPGSVKESEDFNVLLTYQKLRTAQDCANAQKDTATSLATMFGGAHNILNRDEVDRLSFFMLKAYAASGLNAYVAKETFKRPRPYQKNPLIKPCIELESSYAYPSGHTMMVRLYARILSQVFPERAELFIKRADGYSLNRVIGGVHHPSDIYAANIVADYLSQKMIKNEKFMEALNSL